MPALIIALIIMLIILGPLLTIWSLNTLFGLQIDINIATWFAMLWLGGVLKGRAGSSSKD